MTDQLRDFVFEELHEPPRFRTRHERILVEALTLTTPAESIDPEIDNQPPIRRQRIAGILSALRALAVTREKLGPLLNSMQVDMALRGADTEASERTYELAWELAGAFADDGAVILFAAERRLKERLRELENGGPLNPTDAEEGQ